MIDMFFWMVLLLVLARCTAVEYDTEKPSSFVNKTRSLVDNLRRLLMEDNYDYQQTDNESGPTPTGRDSSPAATPEPREQLTRSVFRPADDNSEQVSRKDLMYYMDVEKMRRKMYDNGVNSTDDSLEHAESTSTTSRAKYKLIKVKDGGKGSPGQFIQEESPAGVSIIRLDDSDGPFPQFQLPAARRQYMSDDTDAGHDDDPTAHDDR